MHLLVVYDLGAGHSVRMEEYADSRLALEERFAAETTAVGRMEIVVLGGEIANMKRTHSKYFVGLDASQPTARPDP